MSGNERELWIGQFSIDHMKIGPAYRTRVDPHEDLSGFWLRLRHFGLGQWRFGFKQNHRTHSLILSPSSKRGCRADSDCQLEIRPPLPAPSSVGSVTLLIGAGRPSS